MCRSNSLAFFINSKYWSTKSKIEILVNKLNFVSREEFEVQKKIIEKLQKQLNKKKNTFKGKIGVFNVQNNEINHKLNFYQINEGNLKEIF